MKFKNWLDLEKDDLIARLRGYPKFRYWFFFFVLLAFFVNIFWLWGKTNNPLIRDVDENVITYFEEIHTGFFDSFFGIATQLAGFYVIATIFTLLALFLVLNKRKRAAAVMLFILLLGIVFGGVFRNIFGRPRPISCLPTFYGESCFSFPSMHATTAIYFYGLANYMVFRFFPISMKNFVFLAIVSIVIIFVVGMSRVYLGAHYPSDIIGGYLLGGAFLLLAVFFLDILY